MNSHDNAVGNNPSMESTSALPQWDWWNFFIHPIINSMATLAWHYVQHRVDAALPIRLTLFMTAKKYGSNLANISVRIFLVTMIRYRPSIVSVESTPCQPRKKRS